MKGGRHIRYDKPTPLANLHLTLLDKVGVRLDSFADSQGKVDELFEPLVDLAICRAVARMTRRSCNWSSRHWHCGWC